MKRSIKSITGLSLLVIIIVSATPSSHALAQWDSFLLLLPDETNAVVAIDVEGLRSNPLGLLPPVSTSDLHPGARYVLIGSLLDPETMRRAWELGLVMTFHGVDLETLATKIDGYVDEISGHTSVRTTTGAHVVKLGEDRVGALHPASRQQVAEWLGERRFASGASSYLRNAVNSVGRNVSFLAAIDLENAISPAQAQRILSQSAYASEVRGLERNLGALLSNTIGMTFSMHAGATVEGRFQVDFPFRPNGLKAGDVGHKLLLEAIADRGAYLDEFAEWNSQIVGNSLVLQGTMTVADARQLLKATRLKFDTNFLVASDQNAEESVLASSLAVDASVVYLRHLTDQLDHMNGYRGSSAHHFAGWLRRTADLIAELPKTGVDPDLLDFGVLSLTRFCTFLRENSPLSMQVDQTGKLQLSRLPS